MSPRTRTAVYPPPAKRSPVYRCRHAARVPLPALKAGVSGSQAMSPAAAMTGSDGVVLVGAGDVLPPLRGGGGAGPLHAVSKSAPTRAARNILEASLRAGCDGRCVAEPRRAVNRIGVELGDHMRAEQ